MKQQYVVMVLYTRDEVVSYDFYALRAAMECVQSNIGSEVVKSIALYDRQDDNTNALLYIRN